MTINNISEILHARDSNPNNKNKCTTLEGNTISLSVIQFRKVGNQLLLEKITAKNTTPS